MSNGLHPNSSSAATNEYDLWKQNNPLDMATFGGGRSPMPGLSSNAVSLHLLCLIVPITNESPE